MWKKNVARESRSDLLFGRECRPTKLSGRYRVIPYEIGCTYIRSAGVRGRRRKRVGRKKGMRKNDRTKEGRKEGKEDRKKDRKELLLTGWDERVSHPFRNPSGAWMCSCSYRIPVSLLLSFRFFSSLSFSRWRATVILPPSSSNGDRSRRTYCIYARVHTEYRKSAACALGILSCINVVGFARESRLPSARYAIRLSLSLLFFSFLLFFT